jgi:hypothetical protein
MKNSRKHSPVNECRLPIEFDDALLCSEIDTESKEPIDSPQPRFEFCDFSASEEFVKVDNGLVLLDPIELIDCLCFVL